MFFKWVWFVKEFVFCGYKWGRLLGSDIKWKGDFCNFFLFFWVFRILFFLLWLVSLVVIDIGWLDFLWRILFLWILMKLIFILSVCFMSVGMVVVKFLLGVYLKLCIRMLFCIDLDWRLVILLFIMDIFWFIWIIIDCKSFSFLCRLMFLVLSVEILL